MPKQKLNGQVFKQDLSVLVPGAKVRFTRRFGASFVRGSYEAMWVRQKRTFDVIFVEASDQHLGGCMV